MKSGSVYGSTIPSYKYQYKSGLKSSLSNNNNSGNCSDRDSIASSRGKRPRSRKLSNGSIKLTKTMSKKTKGMDYTNYNYNTAVNRLKFLLADSYTPAKQNFSYSKNAIEDSGEDTDNMSINERPVLSEISKYLSPSYISHKSGLRPSALPKKFKPFNSSLSSSKENMSTVPNYTTSSDYLTATPAVAVTSSTAMNSNNNTNNNSDSIQAPTEILSFIEKQEDYIEQLEKESKFCRSELSNLLGKVKDVISENEALTEHARSDLAKLGRGEPTSSESDEHHNHNNYILKSPSSSSSLVRKKDKSPRYLSGPNIIFESKISELEAELAQSSIDLKKLRAENDELKRKVSSGSGNIMNCEIHRKQIESLQKDKIQLEDQIRRLQHTIDDMRTESAYSNSKRHLNDMAIIERSQADLEVKHLRDELDRQHERVRELQHEMARRVAEERSSAERRYNLQVDQLGGDLNSQWEQVSKLQMDLERQKRIEVDMKRDISQRNGQIEELKMELKNKRSSFLSDIAQVNAEKQSLEQEITSLRLQLDRADRSAKIEAARLNAEINSIRQRLDRADADVLHAKRENLRLGDEIANLEKEVTLGEMKNEIRPTRKDIDKSFQEMQEKHAGTVTELEEMIQNQKHLMDKLTGECKTLTNKLEDTSLKHKMEIAALQSNVEYLTNRVINSDRIGNTTNNNNDNISTYSNSLPQSNKAHIDYESPLSTSDNRIGNISTDAINRGSIGGDESISLSSSSKPFEYKSSIDYTKSPLSTTARLDTITPTPTDNIIPNRSSELYTPATPYTYGDDENQKDNFGEGDKFSRNGFTGIGKTRTGGGSITDTNNPYSSVSATNQPLGENGKSYGTTKDVLGSPSSISGRAGIGSSSIEPQYEEQAPAGQDYSQYSTEAYEGYDPQQYDNTGFETNYDQQQYDGTQQQYDGTTDYEGAGQQYEGYNQDYNQTYQPDITSYETTQQQAQPPTQQLSSVSPQIPSQQQASSILPTGSIGQSGTISAAGGTLPTAAAMPTTESRPQPRTSGSNLGLTGAGIGGTTGQIGDNRGSTVLQQQPAQNFKGISGGTKN